MKACGGTLLGRPSPVGAALAPGADGRGGPRRQPPTSTGKSWGLEAIGARAAY
jgi:hypothetical protein